MNEDVDTIGEEKNSKGKGKEDGAKNTNTDSNESRYNTGESKVVAKIIDDLIESNITADMIGVITPYRGQVKAIKEQIKNTS